jgi:hypothetical protein
MKHKSTGRRRGYADLFDRVIYLVVQTDKGIYPTRRALSTIWGCSPRAVSHLVDHAKHTYGVRVRSVTERNRGYELVSPGVLNLTALKERA